MQNAVYAVLHVKFSHIPELAHFPICRSTLIEYFVFFSRLIFENIKSDFPCCVFLYLCWIFENFHMIWITSRVQWLHVHARTMLEILFSQNWNQNEKSLYENCSWIIILYRSESMLYWILSRNTWTYSKYFLYYARSKKLSYAPEILFACWTSRISQQNWSSLSWKLK